MAPLLVALLVLLQCIPAAGAETITPGADLERFDYPYPVRWFETKSQGAIVRMAYQDVAPAGRGNGGVVVLLHGKNFCAATWGDTIAALTAHGYRVIAPDQIGFCKSSKPAGYQYSFNELAVLTGNLLRQAGVDKAVIVGHSTGGMLAVRFALLFPAQTAALVLVNPLGLNDTLAEGVPYAGLGALRGEEDKTNAASIKAYQLKYYYHGRWRPDYDRWVAMLAGQYASPDGNIVRDAQARLSDMIETQPVAADLPRLTVPLTMIVGQADRTAFRASSAAKALRGRIRTVPVAADAVAMAMPQARLVRLVGLGHAPQVEAPARFDTVLLEALSYPPR